MRWAYVLFSVTGFAALGMSFHATEKKVKQAPDPKAIFQAHCVSCHTGDTARAKLDLSLSTDKLANSYIVAKGLPNSSLLIKRVTSLTRPMPPGGPPLSETELVTLRDWISSQVPNPTPVFQARCIRCHGSKQPAGGLDLTKSLTDLAGAPQVKPGDFANSALYQRVVATTQRMPPTGPALTDGEVKLISGWITSLTDPTPVINGKCMPCHRGASAAGGLNLAQPLTVIAGLKQVSKGDPDDSLLIKRVKGQIQPTMPPPPNGVPLSDGEIGILSHWIQGLSAQ